MRVKEYLDLREEVFAMDSGYRKEEKFVNRVSFLCVTLLMKYNLPISPTKTALMALFHQQVNSNRKDVSILLREYKEQKNLESLLVKTISEIEKTNRNYERIKKTAKMLDMFSDNRLGMSELVKELSEK
jgi:5'-deoxynucleotidase YfbR-like HD superfamily hydrolase